MISSEKQIHRLQPQKMPQGKEFIRLPLKVQDTNELWELIQTKAEPHVGRTETLRVATGQWSEGFVPELCVWWVVHSSGHFVHLAQTKVSWLRHLGMPHRSSFMSMSQHKEFQSGWWYLQHQGWKWKGVYTWFINDPRELLCWLLCEP